MKTILLSLAYISVALACSHQLSAQNTQSRAKHYNVDKSLALAGYDPVSYFSGIPMKGKASLSAVHNDIIYHFASQQNQALFKKEPEKYEPAYGGWCAYAMGETGEKVKVDPETYKILNGKLFLFYNFWGNNTLEDWNQNEKALKGRADTNWQNIVQ